MKQSPLKMNPSTLLSATEAAIAHRKHILAMADALLNDPEKAQRHEAGKCITCYYRHKIGGGRIGGAAITYRDCMCCGETQTYGSTATNVLCQPCSSAIGLCISCGADLDLKKRKKWPEPRFETPAMPSSYPREQRKGVVMLLPKKPA